jgi:hypothetical protein
MDGGREGGREGVKEVELFDTCSVLFCSVLTCSLSSQIVSVARYHSTI